MFSTIVFSALVVIVTVKGQVLDCARTYKVALGDVCDTISAANNASTYQLALVNPQINADCSNLFEGETLCLGEVGHDCNQTYAFVTGDGCWAVSQTFGIGLDVLLANNPNINVDCSNAYPGEVLCVAGENVYA